jgi:hypothetical protein
VKDYGMVSIPRWQYPWILLDVVLFGLAGAGYYISGISIAAIYPAIVGIGLIIIVSRPKRFGYVVSGLGILSVMIAIVLLFKETNPIVLVALLAAGLGGLIVGFWSQKRVTNH